MSDITTEGWKYLMNATKWHYFREQKSLCGRWMTLGSNFEQGNNDSADNCKRCRTILAKEKAKVVNERQA